MAFCSRDRTKYHEISSSSNVRDFQTKYVKIRFKDANENILIHTLNDSFFAVGRTIVVIMENYQNKDCTIEIPEVLKKYM